MVKAAAIRSDEQIYVNRQFQNLHWTDSSSKALRLERLNQQTQFNLTPCVVRLIISCAEKSARQMKTKQLNEKLSSGLISQTHEPAEISLTSDEAGDLSQPFSSENLPHRSCPPISLSLTWTHGKTPECHRKFRSLSFEIATSFNMQELMRRGNRVPDHAVMQQA